MKLIGFLLFSCLLVCHVNSQTTYYVSASNGDDSNSGTTTNPLKTIQACVDKWDGVNQIKCACEGTFTEIVEVSVGGPTESERNVITAWDTDNDNDLTDEIFIIDAENTRNYGIISGSLISGSTNADNVEISYVTIKNIAPPGGDCWSGTRAGFISLQCVNSGGISTGCLNWWIHDSKFDTLTPNCGGQSHHVAIRPSGAPNIIVEDNTFINIAGFVMRYFDHAQNAIIRNNTIHLKNAGIKIWGLDTDNIQVVGNKFLCDGNGYNDESLGCAPSTALNFSNDVQNSVIRNNYFEDCFNSITIGTGSDFGYRSNSNNLIEGNFIKMSSLICNNFTSGIVVDDDPGGVSQISGNYIEVNNLTIRNNYIIYPAGGRSAPGVFITGSYEHSPVNNFEFHNNTISGFDQAITFQGVNATNPLNGITLRNNIYHNIKDQIYRANNVTPVNLTSDYNIISKPEFRWPSTISLTIWRNTTGNDVNSIECDPIFDIGSDEVWRLDFSDNCARDNGTPVASFNNDYDDESRPSGVSWDIGADEYYQNTLGLYDFNLNSINVYTTGSTLRIVGVQNGTASVNVYSILGKNVFEASFQGNGLNDIILPNLKTGIYIVQLESQKGKLNKKIIIQ